MGVWCTFLSAACCRELARQHIVQVRFLYTFVPVEQAMPNFPSSPQTVRCILYSTSTTFPSGALPSPTTRCRKLKCGVLVCASLSPPMMVRACEEK